jgi:hypothetical protein
MTLIIELQDINFQNNFRVYYKINNTPGPNMYIDGYTLSVGTGFTECHYIMIIFGDILVQDTDNPFFTDNNTSLIYRVK